MNFALPDPEQEERIRRRLIERRRRHSVQVYFHPDLERVSEEGSQLASLKSAPPAETSGSSSLSSVDCQAAEKEELMGSRLVLWGWDFAGFWGSSKASSTASRKAKSVQDVPGSRKHKSKDQRREHDNVLGTEREE